jgi:hypothetical protein
LRAARALQRLTLIGARFIHDRAADGKLTPAPELVLPQPPQMDCGGHGPYASVGEYMKSDFETAVYRNLKR